MIVMSGPRSWDDQVKKGRGVKRLALGLVVGFAALVTAATIIAAGFSGLHRADRGQAATSVSVPVALSVSVLCANSGKGEVVALTGAIHLLSSLTIDALGGIHESLTFNPQGVTGFGLTTGTKYQGTGVTLIQLNFSPGGVLASDFISNFLLIGQGPGNNLRVQQTFHLTVNANGVITVWLVRSSITCS